MSDNGGILLVVNAGSSSIKTDCYGLGSLDWLGSISVYGIAQGTTQLRIESNGRDTETHELSDDSFESALHLVNEHLEKRYDNGIHAIGYRVVHGGMQFNEPTIINDEVKQQLRALEPIDPEHAPISNAVIDTYTSNYPEATHVACFDTTFFSKLPKTATLLPIPRKYYDNGIRKYGFHGLSYTYLLEEFARTCGEDAANGRIIMAHLGSGVSLTVLHNGTPIDTTMSFSPTSGIPMSTRSGDIDPSVFWQLQSSEQLTHDEVKEIMNASSGLLGMSELSADMYTLLESADVRAEEAIVVFCNEVKKVIGAYSALLNGLDSIIFAGGIGENAPRIRKRILNGMSYLGIALDEARNNENAELISSDESKVGVHVIPTNESIVIAKEVKRIVS